MLRNEFQWTAYRNVSDMLAAIAEEWSSARSVTTEWDIARFLSESTDEELAAECISGWGLDVVDEDGWSHMSFNEYTASDLAEAFRALR